MSDLKIIDHIPKGFFEIKPRGIARLIKTPTLIHLKGEKDPPIFISALLHGNEFSGLLILQKILKKYQSRPLPFSLIVFIGNPKACAKGARSLKGQADFNRIWRGKAPPYESGLARQVLRYAKDSKIRLAADMHNNSGKNPLYACINKKEREFIKLAQAFSKKIIYFDCPDSVLSAALSAICPSVVIECGLPGDPAGLLAGARFIERLLDKSEKWKKAPVKASHVFKSFAVLRLAPSSKIAFRSPPVLKKSQVCLIGQFDDLNFKEARPGLLLGKIKKPGLVRLIDAGGKNIFNQVFSLKGEEWRVKSPFYPSMFTKNIEIAKSDCLGYAMKKIAVKDFLLSKKTACF